MKRFLMVTSVLLVLTLVSYAAMRAGIEPDGPTGQTTSPAEESLFADPAPTLALETRWTDPVDPNESPRDSGLPTQVQPSGNQDRTIEPVASAPSVPFAEPSTAPALPNPFRTPSLAAQPPRPATEPQTVRIFQLQFMSTRETMEILLSMVDGNPTIARDDRTNSLIIKGTNTQFARVAELLEQLDVPDSKSASRPVATRVRSKGEVEAEQRVQELKSSLDRATRNPGTTQSDNGDARIRDLAQQIRSAVDEAFNEQQRQQLAEIEDLTVRLNKLSKAVRDREAKRETLIDRRITELTQGGALSAISIVEHPLTTLPVPSGNGRFDDLDVLPGPVQPERIRSFTPSLPPIATQPSSPSSYRKLPPVSVVQPTRPSAFDPLLQQDRPSAETVQSAPAEASSPGSAPDDADARLHRMTQTLGDQHPQVLNLKREIEFLRARSQQQANSVLRHPLDLRPETPSESVPSASNELPATQGENRLFREADPDPGQVANTTSLAAKAHALRRQAALIELEIDSLGRKRATIQSNDSGAAGLRSEISNSVAKAKLSLRQVREEATTYVTLLESEIHSATALKDAATENLRRAKVMFDSGTLPPSEVSTAETAQIKAASTLEQLHLLHRLFQEVVQPASVVVPSDHPQPETPRVVPDDVLPNSEPLTPPDAEPSRNLQPTTEPTPPAAPTPPADPTPSVDSTPSADPTPPADPTPSVDSKESGT